MIVPRGQLMAEELPDSAYARELRLGVPQLRFDRELETQFLATHLQRVHIPARVWFSLGIALALVFTWAQAARAGIWSFNTWVEFCGIIPCAFALAWVAWSPHYDRVFLPTVQVLVPLKGALVAAFVTRLVGNGNDEELAALTVYVIAAFFFSGLLFRSAVVAVSAILISYAATALALGLMSLVVLKGFLVLLVTGAMGTMVYYNVERSYRRSFLESALIAELVAKDALTGLMNRRSLDEHLLRVWQQAQRDKRTITVLMVDIDHFKSYNDAHGHQAGDAALRSVALQLNSFARRPLDIAARYGGDEFVVILYDMQLDHVKRISERLRSAVLETATSETKERPAVTVSIGVGVVEPIMGRTPLGALQFADEALYEAKQAGRNCVVVKDLIEYRGVETGSFKTRTIQPN